MFRLLIRELINVTDSFYNHKIKTTMMEPKSVWGVSSLSTMTTQSGPLLVGGFFGPINEKKMYNRKATARQ